MGDVEKIARKVLTDRTEAGMMAQHGIDISVPGQAEVTTILGEPERAGREGDTQPMPITHADKPDIQSMVIADVEARRQLGIQRYGTPLQADNGRNALVDAYEEVLDLACYLKQRIVEEETGRGRVIWHETYTGFLERLVEDMSPIHHRHLIDQVVEATNAKVEGRAARL